MYYTIFIYDKSRYRGARGATRSANNTHPRRKRRLSMRYIAPIHFRLIIEVTLRGALKYAAAYCSAYEKKSAPPPPGRLRRQTYTGARLSAPPKGFPF